MATFRWFWKAHLLIFDFIRCAGIKWWHFGVPIWSNASFHRLKNWHFNPFVAASKNLSRRSFTSCFEPIPPASESHAGPLNSLPPASPGLLSMSSSIRDSEDTEPSLTRSWSADFVENDRATFSPAPHNPLLPYSGFLHEPCEHRFLSLLAWGT